MKTIKLALLGLTSALLTTGAFASDSDVQVIDNHHGSFSYVRAQKDTSVAVFVNGSGLGRATTSVERPTTYRDIQTPHGTVSTFAAVR